MSKYIKQDDIFELARTGVLVSNSNFESVCKHIGSLPTIEVMEYPQVEGITPTLVTTEVSEDAISRAWIKNAMLNYGFTAPDMTVTELIEDAPSVIPKAKEGEWIIEEKDSIYGKKIRLTCSECGDVFYVTEEALPYERYCRYCGSKMKGADNER